MQAGTVYTITDRGRPIAQLAPLTPHPLDRAILAGEVATTVHGDGRVARITPKVGTQRSRDIIPADRDGRG